MKYENEYLKNFLFPVGGIGTGCVSINGRGMLRDFEMFNRPSKGSINGYTHFAVRAETESGKVYTKVICADETENLTGTYNQKHAHSHGYGFGLPSVSMNGMPHFKNVSVECRYPVAEYTFSDCDFPGKIVLKAWNPLIPHDSFNSSLPAAFFELRYIGDGKEKAKVSFSFSFGCPFSQAVNTVKSGDGYKAVYIESTDGKETAEYGDITVLCKGDDTFAQASWYRGLWCDDIVTFWNEFSSGKLTDRSYGEAKKDHATVMSSSEFSDSANAEFILSWNAPNCINYWYPLKDSEGKDVTWKNYYATQFENSFATALYCFENKEKLDNNTELYINAMFGQSLPEKVIEAAANTLSVLRSPTVWRLSDGSFYGFEGVGEKEGSCEGTCQHVWNYAYALCFLFPDLERSIRDLEFKYEMLPSGETGFRLGLPLGRENAVPFPCLDGQMGCVIKTYREWKISGDDEWLKSKWESVKKVLDFARSEENRFKWDSDGDGFLDGRMHHTLDMELFGADGWLEGMYLAALKAAQKMAEYLGDTEKAKEYSDLFESGKRLTSEKLFNGRWFCQNVDLSDKSVLEKFDSVRDYWNEERKEIKYQIGDGCEIDQLLGLWHSAIIGIGEIFDESEAKTAAENIYKNNFKTSLRGFVNSWRLFAVNDEAGTVICTYPDGAYKPYIPIPYCEECMNGFEYSFAGTLIALGFIDEGIKVASAVREKYNGNNRNPFNEIECGSNYARSMASFALIPLLSGFEFDIPSGKVGFNPKINKDNFKCFWSVGTAFGTYEQSKNKAKFTLLKGNLKLKAFASYGIENAEKLLIDGKSTEFSCENGEYTFNETNIKSEIVLE